MFEDKEGRARDEVVRAALGRGMSRREAIRRGTALGLSLPALSALLAACGDDEEKPSASSASEQDGGQVEIVMPPVLRSQQPETITLPRPKDGVQLGFVVPILTEPGETSMANGTKKAAQVAGVKVDVVDANLDLSKQLQLADDQLSRGYDAILNIDLIPKTLDAFYSRADERSVPTITVFSDRPGSIQENAAKPAAEAVEMILAKHPDGARGVVLANTPAPVILDRENPFKRLVGYQDKFGGAAKPDSKIKILEFRRNQKETLEGARAIAEDFLEKHPDLQFIWCTNDVNGLGSALAARAANKDILVFGMNGDPTAVNAVKEGSLTATWDANQNRMGMRAVAHALRWIADGKPPPIVKQEFTRITRENAGDYIPWPERAA